MQAGASVSVDSAYHTKRKRSVAVWQEMLLSQGVPLKCQKHEFSENIFIDNFQLRRIKTRNKQNTVILKG